MNKVVNNISILILILGFVACRQRARPRDLFISKQNYLWRVVQQGKIKSDSSLLFFKANSNGYIDELFLRDGQFVMSALHSDVVNYNKWKIIDDSTIEVFLVPYSIHTLNDSIFIGINKAHFSDTLKFVKFDKRPEARL